MTREEAKRVLKIHLEHWKRLTKEKICTEQEGAETISAFDMAIEALEQEPKTGHWINEKWHGIELIGVTCSNCMIVESRFSDFCPNCGAKMKEGDA